jgi:hypothetical protein
MVQRSDRGWRGAIAGKGERSRVEGIDRGRRELIAVGGN